VIANPSADTLRRVIGGLDSAVFREALIRWTEQLCESTAGKLVAVDVKTVRGAAGVGEPNLQDAPAPGCHRHRPPREGGAMIDDSLTTNLHRRLLGTMVLARRFEQRLVELAVGPRCPSLCSTSTPCLSRSPST